LVIILRSANCTEVRKLQSMPNFRSQEKEEEEEGGQRPGGEGP
jgi:hypothetical protein